MDVKDEQGQDTQDEPVPGQDPRVGDTWESMDPREDSPRRRVQVEAIDDGRVRVRNVSTLIVSHVAIERMVPPHWRFIG